MARVARVARGLATHRLSGSDQQKPSSSPTTGRSHSSLTLRGPSPKKASWTGPAW
jgi:hypothetical protein